jgi:hypothetical protein
MHQIQLKSINNAVKYINLGAAESLKNAIKSRSTESCFFQSCNSPTCVPAPEPTCVPSPEPTCVRARLPRGRPCARLCVVVLCVVPPRLPRARLLRTRLYIVAPRVAGWLLGTTLLVSSSLRLIPSYCDALRRIEGCSPITCIGWEPGITVVVPCIPCVEMGAVDRGIFGLEVNVTGCARGGPR